MANGYWVRRDVLATIRYAMIRSGRVGTYPVDDSLALLRAFAERYEPSAANATDEEWLAGLEAMRRLSPDGTAVRWRESYDYGNY